MDSEDYMFFPWWCEYLFPILPTVTIKALRQGAIDTICKPVAFVNILFGSAIIGYYLIRKKKDDDDRPDEDDRIVQQQSEVVPKVTQKVDNDYEKQPEEVTEKVPKVRDYYIVDVQVYIPQKSHSEHVRNLEELLRKEASTMDLVFEEVDSVVDIKAGQPLLVACMNASRRGTDALNAIKGLKDSKSAMLLVFHHKDEHALPSQPSSRVLVESVFQNLYGIYDVACLTGKGVYKCDMNTRAVKSILEFIKSYQHVNE